MSAVELLGDRDDVLVVRQHDDLVARHGLDRGEELGGRRVERLPAADDAAARRDPGTATRARARSRRRPLRTSTGSSSAPVSSASRAPCASLVARCRHRCLTPRVLVGDLLEQVGHADPARPAVEVERRLDRRADVVGVDVAVPGALAADDHDRVADRSPALLEIADPRVVELEEVHHLVPHLAGRRLGRRCRG